jgi:hypothetical protein
VTTETVVKTKWDLQTKVNVASLLVTAAIAIAAMIVGVVNADDLQTKLLQAGQSASVDQGRNVAVLYLERIESEAQGLARMYRADHRVTSYVRLLDLDPTTSDEEAMLTAGALPGTIQALQSFFGTASNVFAGPAELSGALYPAQLKALCVASLYAEQAFVGLKPFIPRDAGADYTVQLHTACLRNDPAVA